MTIYADDLRHSESSEFEETFNAIRAATEAFAGPLEPIRKLEEVTATIEALNHAVPPTEKLESATGPHEVMDKAALSGVFGSDIQQATISPLPEIESAIFSPSSSATRQLNAVSEALSPVMTGEQFAEMQKSLPVYDTTEISQIMDLMENVSLIFSSSTTSSRSATNTEMATTPSVPSIENPHSIDSNVAITPLDWAPTIFLVAKEKIRYTFTDDEWSRISLALLITYIAVVVLDQDPPIREWALTAWGIASFIGYVISPFRSKE